MRVLREVCEETGIRNPCHLIDLEHQERLIVGDEGVIEWEFGYQARSGDPHELIIPGPKVAETIWANFDEAFQRLERSTDRDALVRLRLRLVG
jgi:hypothetical protein